MSKFNYLKNETEFKIIKALIEELNAEKKKSIKSDLFNDGKKEFSKGTRTTLYNGDKYSNEKKGVY